MLISISEEETQPKVSKLKKLPDNVKKFNAQSVSLNNRVQLVKKILANMQVQATNVSAAGILLAGDPGVGKTSFVRTLSELLGLTLVILEVPHLTEEHIINIPFIKYNPVTNQLKKEVVVGEPKKGDFEIVLSESNLYTTLKKAKRIPDRYYIRNIYEGSNTNVRRLYEALGGTKDSIPSIIEKIRSTYTVILFLDEYFRKTSKSIRNMLRGILNKELGLNKLPSTVYPIYASNINDEGVEEIPSNNQFGVIEMKAPEKDEWFSYTVDRAEDYGIKVKEDIVDKFYEIIEKDDLSSYDPISDTYISPRRWTEILYFVNAALPLPSKTGNQEKYAKALLTNIKTNFMNYKTGDTHPALSKVMDAVSDLIKKYNGIEVHETLKSYEWKDTLRMQLTAKIKLDDLRKYIPVISGPPGIGKTSIMTQIANELKLSLIHIDCSTLSYEDVMGTPLASEENGETTTSFSDSKLYMIIHKKAEENPPAKSYRGYKYIIFFDELNRTDVRTFNGLRKLILEKEFDNGKGLPEKSIVVAALNPEDSGGGITDLTKHMVDVLDIIPATPNWKSTIEWIESKTSSLGLTHPDVAQIAVQAIKFFAERFKDNQETQLDPHFKILVGSESVYISPREYSQIFAESSTSMDMELSEILKEFGLDAVDATNKELVNELNSRLRRALADQFISVIKGIFIKSNIESPEFLSDLEAWIFSDDLTPAFGNLLTFKGSSFDFEETIDELVSDPNTPFVENLELYNKLNEYLSGAEVTQFGSDIDSYITNKISEMGFSKVIEQKYPLREVSGKGVKPVTDIDPEMIPSGKVSLISYMIVELYNTIKLYNLSNDLLSVLKNTYLDLITDKISESDSSMTEDQFNQISNEMSYVYGKYFDSSSSGE